MRKMQQSARYAAIAYSRFSDMPNKFSQSLVSPMTFVSIPVRTPQHSFHTYSIPHNSHLRAGLYYKLR